MRMLRLCNTQRAIRVIGIYDHSPAMTLYDHTGHLISESQWSACVLHYGPLGNRTLSTREVNSGLACLYTWLGVTNNINKFLNHIDLVSQSLLRAEAKTQTVKSKWWSSSPRRAIDLDGSPPSSH